MFKFWKQLLFFGLMIHEGDSDAGGGSTDAAAGDAAGDSGQGGAPAKPEGLEDSFWNADTGEVRLPELIKSYGDTKAAFSGKEESIRERLMAEIQSNRPEAPDKYEIPGDIGIEPPEGYEIKFADDDPMIKMWRDLAFQGNLSQDQFMEGIRSYVGIQLENRIDTKAELEKLGENGQDRITRIDNLLNKHLEQGEVDSLADYVRTAEGVQVLEKLLTGIAGNRVADGGTVSSANDSLTKNELIEMMRDPRYTGRGRERDEGFIKTVMDGWAKIAPGKANVSQRR